MQLRMRKKISLNDANEETREEAVVIRFTTLSLRFPEGIEENPSQDSVD
jgi:hypothetical protein